LKANLALMTAAHGQAEKAIKAAHSNVLGIDKKATALKASSQNFATISQQAIKSLQQQADDRKTIELAVKKAIEVIQPMGNSLLEVSKTQTVDLLENLLQDISSQELKEHAYRSQQHKFQLEFLRYVQDYTKLLESRSKHYTEATGVLELHVSELANDLTAQQATLTTGQQISKQSEGLCESVLSFYDKHEKTRTELNKMLKDIVQMVP